MIMAAKALRVCFTGTSIVCVTQFQRVRRAAIRVVTDEYLDLYVLGITAFACTILGVLGVAGVADLASIILALLAVLALSQIRSRRHIVSIAESHKTDPFAVFMEGFPPDLIERRAAATDLLLIGTSMSRTVQAGARIDMRRTLLNGGRVRVLVLDPTDLALVRAVSVNSSLWTAAERLQRRISGTLDELADLRRETDGRLEIRVASFPPMMGVNALNVNDPNGLIVVQHYEYKPTAEAAPIFALKASDGFWFQHYAAEANRMWQDGTPWPLAGKQALIRVPRPSFSKAFDLELQQAMGGARSILITGVTRNTLVNSNYSKFKEWLRNGCTIRFLLIDPDCAAIVSAADRYHAGRSPGSVRERVRQTIRLLAELQLAVDGIALRLTSHPLAMGIIATDSSPAPHSEHCAVFAEYYTYQAAGEPKFVLQPADGEWYEHFRQEAEALWASATEVSLSEISSATYGDA
jgi:hypothetical protein